MNRGHARALRGIEAPPRELCGYTFIRWLKEHRTGLCRAGNQRLLVLKQLDADCLFEGELHPDIKERLARIRELPHRTVATLTGVQRDTTGRVYSVWEYLDGTSFHTYACDPMRDGQHAARLMRDLVIAVEEMHNQGITHGALHDGNIIVDASGEVRLLDISPLLYADEREDARAMGAMLEVILRQRGETETPTGQALLRSIAERDPLRDMSAAISRSLQNGSAGASGDGQQDLEERKSKRRATRLAIVTASAAAIIGLALWFVFSETGKAPPQAPKEAMQQRH